MAVASGIMNWTGAKRAWKTLAFKNMLLLLPVFFFTVTTYAQDEVFASDRPGLSDAPDLIKPHTWQIATGFDISKYNHSGNYQLSENTLKYGLSKLFEARFDMGLQFNPTSKIYGVSGPSIGMKFLLLNQHKAIPKTAFIVEYYPSIFSSAQQSSGLASEFCFNHAFKNGNNFYYNAGINWQDITQKPTWNGLVGFSLAATDKLDAFIEFYLFRLSPSHTNYVSDIGGTYQLNSHVQFDFSAGLDIIHPPGNFYYSGGITYNFR